MANVKIFIVVDSNGELQAGPAVKKNTEKVEWINKTDMPIDIDFAASPFVEPIPPLAPGGKHTSNVDPNADGPYDYTVSSGGECLLDPTVIVDT